jgi:hypothetical protein
MLLITSLTVLGRVIGDAEYEADDDDDDDDDDEPGADEAGDSAGTADGDDGGAVLEISFGSATWLSKAIGLPRALTRLEVVGCEHH